MTLQDQVNKWHVIILENNEKSIYKTKHSDMKKEQGRKTNKKNDREKLILHHHLLMNLEKYFVSNCVTLPILE